MSTDDKKINVDDISFDDMLGGGIEDTVDTTEEPQKEETSKPEEDEKTEEILAEASLDDDIEAKEEEEDDKPKPKRKAVTSETTDKSSETSEIEEEKELDDSVVGQVLSKLGYETEESYDDTTEGLISLTKDVGGQMADEQLDKLFERYPLIKDHLDYVVNGGRSQDFMTMHDPRSDYSKMKIRENDHRTQKYVLGQYFKAKGHDSDFVEEMINDYEDGGKLFNKASAAKTALEKAQKEERNTAMEGQRQQLAEQQKQTKEFWDGVYDTIDKSNEFKGISVPEREKSKFYDYLSTPVTKEGYTQRDLDHTNSEMDVKLAIDYLMFKGFNLDKLIDKKARTKSTQNLKDKIKGHQETIKSAKKARRTSTSVDIDDLNLDLF